MLLAFKIVIISYIILDCLNSFIEMKKLELKMDALKIEIERNNQAIELISKMLKHKKQYL